MTADELQCELTRRGLSVRRAAAVLELDPSYLWRLLSGQRPIGRDRADLIQMRLADYDRSQKSPAQH